MVFNGTNWQNNTFSILTLKGTGIWNITTNSSTSNFYEPTNISRNFTVYGYMNITDNSTNPTTIYAYESTVSTCRVQDHHTSYMLNNITVEFYIDGTIIGTNNTDSTGYASYGHQINTSGTHTITCNITNQPNKYYYKGPEYERNISIYVQPFPIAAVNPTNGTTIDRDSASATDPDVILLNVTVPSYVPNGQNIEFTANLTDPTSIAGQTNIYLGNNTTTNGYAYLWYNANSSYYAGNYTWWANSTAGTPNETRIITVKGAFNLKLASNSANPYPNYTQNSTPTITVNITSNGPENTNQLNSTYFIQANTTYQNTTGNTYSIGLLYNGTNWQNNTFSILTLKGTGIWNITANTTGTYWYSNETNTTTTVYGYMNITENITTPERIYAFETTSTTCRVQDQHTGYDVNNANVSFYRNGTLIGTNLTNSTGYATITHQITTTGTYELICNVTNQPNIHSLS